MTKSFWKKILMHFVIMAMMGSLLGCKASSGNETQGAMQTPETTVATTAAPTEPGIPKIVIRAPFDIYNFDPEPAKEIDLQTIEGYQMAVRQEGTTHDYYDAFSGSYCCVLFVIEILEEEARGFDLEYEAKTNHGSLRCNLMDARECKGKKANFKEYTYWRLMEHPSGYLDLSGDRIWVDICIKAEGKIIGFVVYEILWTKIGTWSVQYGEYRYSEYYPQIDGNFQDITKEFVNSRIDACHQYFMNNAE